LDLKAPLGGLLTFYGLLLLAFGLFSKREIYQKSLGVNINLIWGILVLVVGGLLLLAALAKTRRGGTAEGPIPPQQGGPACSGVELRKD
jgi:hypothetical protein